MAIVNNSETMMRLIGENWPDALASQSGIVVSIQRLARLFQRISATALEPLGLTPHEFELLATLRSHPAPHQLTPSSLYDSMLMSSGGLTKLLKTLEARSLVHRPQSAGDRRSRPVALTAEGRVIAESAMRAVQRAEAPLIEEMTTPQSSTDELAERLIALVAAAEARFATLTRRRMPAGGL
ncbi:MAG: MarR family transcriptional regulator [Paracoccus sp. (in: a-proteobacteria)]|nr:MarR family transcriptional regulator [Paracoccus sp. (in: a-proteobacteria)]